MTDITRLFENIDGGGDLKYLKVKLVSCMEYFDGAVADKCRILREVIRVTADRLKIINVDLDISTDRLLE